MKGAQIWSFLILNISQTKVTDLFPQLILKVSSILCIMNSEYMPKFWEKKVVVVVGRIQILFKIPDLPTWPLSTHYSSLALYQVHVPSY